MNSTLAKTKCTILSLENSQNSATEERLLVENEKCHLIAISDTRTHTESERVKYLPGSTLSKRSGDYEGGIIDFIRTSAGGIVDLLIIGTEKDSYDYVKLLLTETGGTSGVTVCQVNLLYREPRSYEVKYFFEAVRSLTLDDRYFLMRADRDRQSLKMQLFFVNHLEPYCLDRYMRMYSFD
ncbi:unnamed protein product [Cylicocyclus nassatus]|uniref:Uncharacterized protein n=1 Tax=Cylicocyclus nassatus TaxID=53992 RepID=A0AA36M7N7_CYLNA|nr:unnamed protein product [Cylicocyclus nassatus]CAJ0600650.1 unnamed protein product [Cylicocyclus nassatus]